MSSFRIERRDAVAHVILCDSTSRNALTRDFWMQFPKIVRDLDRDGEIRALILRGEGNHFSSGIDVSLLASFVAGPGDQELGRYRANLRLMLFGMHEVFEALAKALSECRGDSRRLPWWSSGSCHGVRHPTCDIGRLFQCSRDPNGNGR